jgi:hypothetical protein
MNAEEIISEVELSDEERMDLTITKLTQGKYAKTN